jgi:hypothetical protein
MTKGHIFCLALSQYRPDVKEFFLIVPSPIPGDNLLSPPLKIADVKAVHPQPQSDEANKPHMPAKVCHLSHILARNH